MSSSTCVFTFESFDLFEGVFSILKQAKQKIKFTEGEVLSQSKMEREFRKIPDFSHFCQNSFNEKINKYLFFLKKLKIN